MRGVVDSHTRALLLRSTNPGLIRPREDDNEIRQAQCGNVLKLSEKRQQKSQRN